jgi:hypothetical protein
MNQSVYPWTAGVLIKALAEVDSDLPILIHTPYGVFEVDRIAVESYPYQPPKAISAHIIATKSY